MNTLTLNQHILLNIKRFGINGEGIGYYKKLAVFVNNAIPGETVEVSITEIYDKYAKGDLVKQKGEISPNRVEPACPYFKQCGGCQLMHLDYPAQLAMKKDLVKEAFDRYYDGKLSELLFKDTIGMDEPYRYRNKVKLPVRYDGEKLLTGLYEAGTNFLLYVEDCLIEKADIRECVKAICDHLTRFQVIAYHPKSKEGVLRHIVVRSSKATEEIQVTLILFKNDERTKKIAKDLININHVASVYININDDPESLENFGNYTEKLIGQDTIVEKIDTMAYELLPTAFFQLNLEQTQKLYNLVKETARFKGYEKVVDGYCGVGTIGLYVSDSVTEVRGVDNNKEAIINANDNAKLNGVKNATFYRGELTSRLEQFREKGFEPDVLIVDPPRIGLEQRLIRYLQDHPVKKLIYVSCNPATLAKNCNHLQKTYHILKIQPLDMFPQTANVECVVCLERR